MLGVVHLADSELLSPLCVRTTLNFKLALWIWIFIMVFLKPAIDLLCKFISTEINKTPAETYLSLKFYFKFTILCQL